MQQFEWISQYVEVFLKMANFLTSDSVDENGILAEWTQQERILTSFWSLFNDLALIAERNIHSYKYWVLVLEGKISWG